MGVLAWVAAGILVGVVLRIVARLSSSVDWTPSISLAVLGGILGGFALDLFRRGDSVIDFRGPTIVGATVGALLILAASFVVAKMSRSGRQATRRRGAA